FFIDPARLPNDFPQHVGQGVDVFAPEHLQSRLELLTEQAVIVDPATSNAWIKLVLQNCGAKVIAQADPCLLTKARKNDVEIAGMKA
ncbi:aminopeptidase P family N-terminal domain-containing protein, partial [Vibrio campbellii]